MSKNSLPVILAAFFVIFAVSGCETVPKKFKEEVSGIKTKVDTLESRVGGVEEKQAGLERATAEQNQELGELRAIKEMQEKTNISVKPRGSVMSKEHTKEIQTYLKNAGFYTGKIDGIKGRNTKRAIKEFQKANGLKVDGIVGKKTWEILSGYASAPGQAQASALEEGAATK